MKITKKFRGILGLALSAMLALGSVTTSATTKNEGTVLPDPNAKGSITIHKYAMESMPNPGTPANGLEDDSQLPEGAKPLEGVSFKIEKVADNTLPEQIVGNNTEAVVRDESFEAQTITTANGENGTTKGVASIGELPQGIYLVTELDNAGVLEKGNPFLVSIPMAHPTTPNSWLYDVHVYPKNVVAGGPSIDKDVTSEGNKHETAGIGKDVKWIIKPSIPADISDAKKYDIIDELDKRLNYTDNLEVYFVKNGEKVGIDQTYYSLEAPKTKNDTKPENGGGTIKISFNEQGRKYLSTQFTEGVSSIRISFTTVINTSAALATEIPNNVTLDYTNSFGTNTEYNPSQIPEVHTGGILLEKVDASNNNVKLQGAKFKIYPSLKDAKDGTNAIVNPADKTQEWEVTTGKDGRAIFEGLAYGVTGNNVTTGSTDYWIVETVAPRYDSNGDGEITEADKQYNLLREPLKVTVNATSHLESNKVTVENRKFILPVTGGMGTVIFTLGGLAIMGAAAFLYMRTTKRA